MWPLRKARRQPDTEARRAIERAYDAVAEAESDLSTARALGRESRTQREINHFGPMIYDSMRRKATG